MKAVDVVAKLQIRGINVITEIMSKVENATYSPTTATKTMIPAKYYDVSTKSFCESAWNLAMILLKFNISNPS